MNIFLIDNAYMIRLGSFGLVFIIMAVWENLAPRRSLNASKSTRWINNLSITFLNSLVVKIILPATATGVAIVARNKGFGLLNIMGASSILWGFIAIVALDFTIYLQHRLFHRIPILWRLHRMHHTD